MDQNVEILKESNIQNNYFLLASHSGTNKNAYFNDLEKLSINDMIYITINNQKQIYNINDIYLIDKTGYLEVKEYQIDTLILITCSIKYQNKQLIVVANKKA